MTTDISETNKMENGVADAAEAAINEKEARRIATEQYYDEALRRRFPDLKAWFAICYHSDGFGVNQAVMSSMEGNVNNLGGFLAAQEALRGGTILGSFPDDERLIALLSTYILVVETAPGEMNVYGNYPYEMNAMGFLEVAIHMYKGQLSAVNVRRG